jgi:hypothetical protein
MQYLPAAGFQWRDSVEPAVTDTAVTNRAVFLDTRSSFAGAPERRCAASLVKQTRSVPGVLGQCARRRRGGDGRRRAAGGRCVHAACRHAAERHDGHRHPHRPRAQRPVEHRRGYEYNLVLMAAVFALTDAGAWSIDAARGRARWARPRSFENTPGPGGLRPRRTPGPGRGPWRGSRRLRAP